MKRILIAGIGGAAMVAMLGMTGMRYAAALHDSTPECCQKKESCCPGASCCKSGSHSHMAQCPMMKHA